MLGRSVTCAEHKRSHFYPLDKRMLGSGAGSGQGEVKIIILRTFSQGEVHLLPSAPRRKLSCVEHPGREREGRREDKRGGKEERNGERWLFPGTDPSRLGAGTALGRAPEPFLSQQNEVSLCWEGQMGLLRGVSGLRLKHQPHPCPQLL